MKNTTCPPAPSRASVSQARPRSFLNLNAGGGLRALLRDLLLFATLLSCAPAAAAGRPAAPTPPAAPEDCASPSEEGLKSFATTLSNANEALDKAKTAGASMEAAAAALKDGLKTINLDADTVNKFDAAAKALKAGVSTEGGKLTAHAEALRAATQAKNRLDGKYADVVKKCASDPDASPKIKSAKDDYDNFNKAYDAQTKLRGSLAEGVKALPDNVKKLVGLLEKAASEANALNADLDPQTLRNDLAARLPNLAKAMTVRRLLVPVLKGLSEAL